MVEAFKCDICGEFFDKFDEEKLINAKKKDMIYLTVDHNIEHQKELQRIPMDICEICSSKILERVLELIK